MERKTKITRFDVSYLDLWYAHMGLFSTVEDKENFSVTLDLPIENPNLAPEEIRKEVFEKLVKTFEEVNEDLKKIKY